MPPFTSKDESQSTTTNCNNFNKSKRRSFRKKKDRPKAENVKGLNADHRVPDTEDISVPKDIDLVGLPELCFPGIMWLSFNNLLLRTAYKPCTVCLVVTPIALLLHPCCLCVL